MSTGLKNTVMSRETKMCVVVTDSLPNGENRGVIWGLGVYG